VNITYDQPLEDEVASRVVVITDHQVVPLTGGENSYYHHYYYYQHILTLPFPLPNLLSLCKSAYITAIQVVDDILY